MRDCFALAKKKIEETGAKGSIIFIDELDAIGIKRSGDGEGSHELQRTLLELLNAMDGFSSDSRIKVIAATNRPDILDPALLRPKGGIAESNRGGESEDSENPLAQIGAGRGEREL